MIGHVYVAPDSSTDKPARTNGDAPFRVIAQSTGADAVGWDIDTQIEAQGIADNFSIMLQDDAYEVRDAAGVMVYSVTSESKVIS